VPTSRGDARHFEVNTLSWLDHGVDWILADCKKFAAQRAAIDIELHRSATNRPAATAATATGNLARRHKQIVDQRVDRSFHVGP